MREKVIDCYAATYCLLSAVILPTLLLYLFTCGVALNILLILWWKEVH